MPIQYENQKIIPKPLVSPTPVEIKPEPKETKAQYVSRMKAMKEQSAGTGIRTGMPPPSGKE